MRNHAKELEEISNDLVFQLGQKPNYTDKDFLNITVIFMAGFMDKMFNVQDFDKMDLEQRMLMATKAGEEVRKLVHTYTGLDTHELAKL
jgi:hypothetical protein